MNNDLYSYFQDPEFKELLAKYEGMVESHTPTYFEAEELTDIAEYYTSINEENKANDAIDYALRIYPSNTDALIFKSRSLAIKGQINEAYRIADLIEDPSDREVKFLKADLLMEEKRFEEAEIIFLELADTEDESTEVLLDIAITYMDVNQKEYAAQWLEKVRAKGINETNSQMFRDTWADFCMTFGRPEDAVQALQISLDEHPYSIQHWNGLAKCYLAQEKPEQAHEAVDFALAIDENNDEALETKGLCYMQGENYPEAIRLYKKVLPISNNKSRIFTFLSKCYFELEMIEEALDNCKNWLKQCPKLTGYEKSEIYSYMAMCLSNLNQLKEGMDYIDASLSLNPFNPGAILQKGMLHLQCNEYEQAQQLFHKTLTMSPKEDEVEVLYHIANCYFFVKMYDEVITWCNQIIKNHPGEEMEAVLLVAASYSELGNTQKCLTYITYALEINGKQFDENILKDKRFNPMFLRIKELIENQSNN